MVAQSYTPYLLFVGAMKGSVYKDNHHTVHVLKETIANFIRDLPLVELLCLCKQDKMCRCMSTHIWGSFPIFIVS
jgi:hypothetical protein